MASPQCCWHQNQTKDQRSPLVVLGNREDRKDRGTNNVKLIVTKYLFYINLKKKTPRLSNILYLIGIYSYMLCASTFKKYRPLCLNLLHNIFTFLRTMLSYLLQSLTHSSSSTPSKDSCGSGSSMFPSLATMALSSWVTCSQVKGPNMSLLSQSLAQHNTISVLEKI